MKRTRSAHVHAPDPTPANVIAWSSWIPFLVFGIAVAVRLLHVLQLRGTPFFDVLLGDSRGYDEWATRIAAGNWVGTDVFYQAPLYPYFLAVIYAIAGHDLLVVRICQAVLGSAACVLLALAARRLFDVRAALIAGIVAALYAPLIFYDGLLQKAVLDIFFTCLLIWVMSGIIADGGSRKSWLALGLAAGGLALTRENALAFFVVLLAMAVFPPAPTHPNTEKAAASAGVNAGVLIAGLLIVLLPVALRNYAVGGGFYLTTSQFGPNFYIGNNPKADGTYRSLRPGRGAPEYEREDATALAERAQGRSLTPSEVSSYWTGRAVSFMRAQPSQWLRLVGRKAVLVVNAAENTDTEAPEAYVEWSWPIRVLGWAGHFGFLSPLAALGMLMLWPQVRRLWPLYAMTAVYVASLLLFYVFGRYRVPLVPFMLLFVAGGLPLVPAFLRTTSAPLRGVAVATLAILLVISNWPIVQHGMPQAVTDTNMGIALKERGRIAEANEYFARAVQANAGYAPGHINVAVSLAEKGKPNEAVAAFERAIAASPRYADGHLFLALELQRQNQHAPAITEFRQYLELSDDPTNLIAVKNALAFSLLAQRQVSEAGTIFRETLTADPSNSDAHRGVADVLFMDRRYDLAAREYQEAVRLAPEGASAYHGLALALAAQNNTGAAIPLFIKAADLAPQNAAFRRDAGTALASVKRLDEAIGQYRRAAEIAPGDPGIQSMLGAALAASGKLADAVVHFRRAVELDPTDAQAARDLQMALQRSSAGR